MMSNRGVEDEELAEESGGERHAGERRHRDQHGKGEKGRTFGQAVEIFNVFPGLLRHDNEDGEAQAAS